MEELKLCYDDKSLHAHQDHSFGVPIFCLRGELFWGHDRVSLLEERLVEFRLERAPGEPEGS